MSFKTDLRDPVTGLNLYLAHLDNAVKILADGHPVGIIAVRLIDAIKIEAVKGRRALERTTERATKKIAQNLAGAFGASMTLGINGLRGNLFVAFTTRVSEKKSVTPENLFLLAEKFNSVKIDNYPLGAGSAVVYFQEQISPHLLLYQGIERACAQAMGLETPRYEQQTRELKQIMLQKSLRTVFQPIVSLYTSEIIAYEALTRGPARTEYENPEFLFALARQSEALQELDILCRDITLSNISRIRWQPKVFINVFAHTLTHWHFVEPKFMQFLSNLKIDPRRIVFEISEKAPITAYAPIRKNAHELREHGFEIAIDDVGKGYSNLRTLYEVEPDYIKIDHSLVRNIHSEPIKTKVLAVLLDIADDIHANVVAEGIETADEYETVKSLGVRYGQGFHFAKPAPLKHTLAK